MKQFTVLMLAAGMLAGCAVFPVPVGPGAYVGVPVPAVVVSPFAYGHDGHGREHGYRDARYRDRY